MVALACVGQACGTDGGSGPSASPPGNVPADGGVGGDAGVPADGGPRTDASLDGAWSTRASMPVPQQETAVVAVGGKIYVLGGFLVSGQITPIVHVYDPATDTWATSTPLPEPLHHVNAAVVDEKIWVVGALRGGDFGATGLTLVFDPAQPAAGWAARTAMPAGTERGASAVAAIGKRIYVAGGIRASASVADFSVFDTEAGTWTSLPAVPTPRDHGVGAAAGGLFYSIGGRSASLGGHSPRVDAYDPATMTWSARAPMPTSRAGCASATARGLVVVFGGEGNPASPKGVFSEVEAYDPAADRWLSLPPMPTPRHGMGAATVGEVIYVPGGGDVQALGPTEVVEALAL